MPDSKPHLLMLTPYLPYPPVSGGRMRTYNLLKHLREDYDISLVCFGRPEELAFDITPLGELCDYTVIERASSPGTLQAALLSISTPRPITMRLYSSENMTSAIRRIVKERPAVVAHVESFYMLQNLPPELVIPVLLSEPAIEYIAWARHARVAQPWYTRPGIALEAFKMRLWEPGIWGQAEMVGAMSAIDAKLIGRAAPKAEVTLTPNGVDVDFFQPNPLVERDSCTAVYMGDYKYFPNSDAVLYFAEEILPLVRAKRPDFRLVVLGKDPSPEIQALQSEPVIVTGLVDDTRPYLQNSAVFICPLRSGSGTRFKLMEALACGCPVVSTTLGCEGLGAVDGEHMLIRDEPQAFADAVVELLENPTLGRKIGQQGRNWVAQNHAWSHSAALVRNAYAKMMRQGAKV
jgi:polysaccharide biosynthesis protein PslH